MRLAARNSDKRLGELAARVGRLTARFANQPGTRGAGSSGKRVQVCLLGVFVDQQTGHHEMPRDLVGELLGKGLQGLTGVLVEVLGADVVRDRRTVIDLLRCGAVALFLATITASFVRLAVPTRGLRLAVTAWAGGLPSRRSVGLPSRR